jgi:hypothetical protein
MVGRTADDEADLLAIWLTGRSEASRGRYLDAGEGDAIAVRFLPEVGGPEQAVYRLYTASRTLPSWVVAGNGDHVEPLAERLQGGAAFADALTEASFEEDPPIWTPRIVGALPRVASPRGRYLLGQAYRRDDGTPGWSTFAAERLLPGTALALQTYEGDPVQVRPRVGTPIEVAVDGDASAMAKQLHAALAPGMRVATAVLVVRPDGPVEAAVVNEHVPAVEA